MGKCKIYLTGYYGQNNLGDDYIFYSIVDQVSLIENVIVKVEVGNSNFNEQIYKDIAKNYDNVTVKTVNISGKVGKLRKLISLVWADFWIIGGGGLFVTQNVNEMKHINLYIRLARCFNTKVSLYGIDIDLFSNKDYVKEWIKLGNLVDFIGTRNDETANKLKKYIDNFKIHSGVDITHCFFTYEEKYNEKQFLEKYGISDKYIIWAVAAPWKRDELINIKLRNRYIKLCNQFKNILIKYSEYTHVFLPFFEGTDIDMIREICNDTSFKYIIIDQAQIGDKRLLFKNASKAIVMRFHGIQFALFYGIPFMAISYSPKTSNILNELNLSELYIEYGIKKGMYFDKEFDINDNELLEKTEKALSGIYNKKIKDASNKLKKIALTQKYILIRWLKNEF